MKKVYAYNERNIPYSLSNYMYSNGKGYEEEAKEMVRIANQCNTAKELCTVLNSHKWTTEKFEPYKEIPNGFIIMATDPWGNKSYIRVMN